MADRTIKPDSGNDLVLQNNGGGTKIEIPNSGDIAITGTIGSGTIGSSVIFPSGMSYFLSALSEFDSDTGDVTLNTTHGFGDITGPITLPDDTRIRMHFFGGIIEYDAGQRYGSSLNWKVGSTFSGSTDGSFTNSVNWLDNQTIHLASNYINAEYSNTSGSSVYIYFRPGLRSTQSTTARVYATGGTGALRTWYELIKI